MIGRSSVSNGLVKNWLRVKPALRPLSESFSGSFSRLSSANLSTGTGTKVYGIHQTDSDGKYNSDHSMAGDHSGRQQNHIWSKEEIDSELKALYRHKPVTIPDKITNAVVSIINNL